MRKTIFSLIMLTAIACQDGSNQIVMSREDMAAYLIDIHIAEAQVQNLRLKRILRRWFLKFMKITFLKRME